MANVVPTKTNGRTHPKANVEAAKPLRAVLVSYAFPPVGGAGVQRMLKLAKYLPLHGVTPTVLTVENPSVPVTDASLERDVSPELRVVRARTLEPGYGVKKAAWAAAASPTLGQRAKARAIGLAKHALVPDPQVLWVPGAAASLAKLVLREKPDVVLVSGPPFSQFLLAPVARLGGRTAVVLDYRDEWSTYRSEYEMMGKLAAVVGGPLERALVRAAHAVTTATDRFRENLLAQIDGLEAARVHAIPNGYDPDDLPRALPPLPKDRLVLTYAGTVFRLTSARGLLGAIRRLHARHPDLAKLLEVRFFGRIVDTEADAFTGMDALGVKRLGYVPHERVLPELAASHMALCLLDDVPGAERIYPGKVFELLALGRPCLTLAPPGALADLALRHALGDVVHPRDEEAICAVLVERLRQLARGSLPAKAPVVDIERYDRRNLAGEFAAVLRDAAHQVTR